MASRVSAGSSRVSAESSRLSAGTNSFAVNLFKVISKDKPNDNVCVSPLSLQIVLALAYSGARGPTAKEIADVLQIKSDNTTMLEDYKNLIDSLQAPELKIANNMFLESSFEVKPDFNKNALSYFKSDVQKVNFVGDSNGARNIINKWVESQTNNKIQDLLSEGSVSSDTVLVLVNAIYFLADWKRQFSEHFTREDKFYVTEKDTVNVDMMFMSETLHYGESAALDAKILELPYKNHQFRFYVILPNKIDGLANLEEKLSTVNLIHEISSLGSFKVDVNLPKFKLTDTLDLGEVLKKLGARSMFTDSADFSGISDKPIAVSKVVQKTFIDVNEKGTEAAAATGFGMVNSFVRVSFPKAEFKADHPFLYLIVNTNELSGKNVLFMGKLQKL